MCKETTLFSDVLMFKFLDTAIYTRKVQEGMSNLLLDEAKKYIQN